MTVEQFSRSERVFLAGCIKSMILADGGIEVEELEELDQLVTRLKFADFEECLDDFEADFRDTETFWSKAAKVGAEARGVIVDVLEELSLYEGVPHPIERKLLDELKVRWSA